MTKVKDLGIEYTITITSTGEIKKVRVLPLSVFLSIVEPYDSTMWPDYEDYLIYSKKRLSDFYHNITDISWCVVRDDQIDVQQALTKAVVNNSSIVILDILPELD